MSFLTQTITKPTVLRTYYRLIQHLECVKERICDHEHCYARGSTLIIEDDVAAHIREIVGTTFAINQHTIIAELENAELATCEETRPGHFELTLLKLKEAVA